MVLARAREKKERLSQRGVLLPAPTKDDALREILVLQKHRQLLDEGGA